MQPLRFMEVSTTPSNVGNFDLSIYFTYSIGADLLNATKLTNSKVGTTNRNALDVMNSSNRWMTIDSEGKVVTDLAKLAEIKKGKTVAAYYDCFEGNNYVHSWAVEDASYLKLSNMTIGYTLPIPHLAQGRYPQVEILRNSQQSLHHHKLFRLRS